MVLALSRERDRALLVLPDKRTTLRCSPTRRVRNRQECKDRAEEQRRVLRARPAAERVARVVVVVADGGHDEVRAVRSDHARLREPGARVVLLHGGVHAEHRDDDAEREVERDEEAVQRAALAREERVQHARDRDRGGVHARGRADEDPLPEVRAGVLPVLETGLGPGVGEVDEEDEAEEDEDGGSD